MRFFLLLVPLVATAPVVNQELSTLVEQVQDELTTFMTKEQLEQIFETMAELLRSDASIFKMGKDVYIKTSQVLTKTQQQEAWKSIQDAMKSYGGPDEIRDIVINALLDFQDFMGDSMKKDREEFAALVESGKSDQEVNSVVYKRLQSYWNIEFGQKVIDVIKCSMSEEEWEIASKDSAQFMRVDNFNMTYNEYC